MGRPRKLETLTTTISGRVRKEQGDWLNAHARHRFEGELSKTLRWALDQAQTFTWLMEKEDPVAALDEMLHPELYGPPHPEDEIAEAERELEQWKREQAVKRARKKDAAQ